MHYSHSLSKGDTQYEQQLTLMHIHMEMGRVAIMKIMERKSNTQPHPPMTLSEFSKAVRDKHKSFVASMRPHLVSARYMCAHTHTTMFSMIVNEDLMAVPLSTTNSKQAKYRLG